jgi:hypothetical protein
MSGKREAESDPPASAEKKAKIDTSGYALNVNLAVDKQHESKPLRFNTQNMLSLSEDFICLMHGCVIYMNLWQRNY